MAIGIGERGYGYRVSIFELVHCVVETSRKFLRIDKNILNMKNPYNDDNVE
jgi:hypothetical protein